MFINSCGKLYLTKGDTAYFMVEVGGYDMKDGDTLTFSVKENFDDDKYLIHLVAAANEAFNIVPSDTSSLAPGTYYYDVQLTTSWGEIFTIITPKTFYIGEEITND